MKWIDNLSEKLASHIVKHGSDHVKDIKMEGISQEIDILRELKDELIRKESELELSRIEWDKTFDSIVDHIVIIDSDLTISKANKSFIQYVKERGGPWETLLGTSWSEFKKHMELPDDICVVSDCFDTGHPITNKIETNGTVFLVTANPIFGDSVDGLVGVVRISRNITNSEQQSKKLERRSRIYHAISEMSKTLVNHANWNDAVKQILRDLGLAIGASRVYIYRNIDRETRVCSVLQHCFHNDKYRDCTAGTINECLNYDMIPEWEKLMTKGQSVTGTLVECHICPLKHNCTCTDDVVVEAVPIFVDGRWWGFIGFDYMNGTRKWKDDDETLLRIAADVLGGVIYHRGRYWDTIAELEGCEEQLEVIKE
jgi:hypothetical protein